MLQLSFDTAKSGGGKQIVISSETARKLKEAGLRWEPQIGDFWIKEDEPDFIRVVEYRPSGKYDKPLRCVVWIPRLDQLLAEIERRGYVGQLYFDYPHAVTLFDAKTFLCRFHKAADALDEAVAQALLWILEREKGETADDRD